MATIIEVTPDGVTRYDMPEILFHAIIRARELRLARSVTGVLKLLPLELRNEVRATALPPPAQKVCGREGYVFVDELPALGVPPSALATPQ